MTRYLTPLAVLILILTLASLGVLGASPANANHSAPTGLSVTGKTTTSVSLDWNDYPRNRGVVEQYRLRVYDSTGTLLSTRLTGSKTSAYTVTGLSPSTGYQFAVAVQFSRGHVSNYSSRVRATTDAVAVTCPDGQYRAEYFANETLSGSPGITRCEASVNNTWADGQSPGTGIPHEDFSARYRGRISFARGDYEFKVTVDDGVRLYVDGELVIDKWFQQAPTTYTAKRTLAAGFHDIKVEYYDTYLSGTIRLELRSVMPPPPGGQPQLPGGSPPASAGEPSPIAGQGYSKVWGDEFDSLSSTSWGEGIWYDPGSPANSIFVQNGVLNLVSRRSQGYENITVSTEGGTDPKTFRQGYFEARMRWTKGNGAWPAFWLLSYRHAVNPAWPNLNPICSQLGEPVAHCYSAELDVFEGQGSEPNVFYGTIHRNSSNDYGVSNQQNGNNYQPAGVDLTADFHVYGMKWTGSQITWYLDGRQLHSAPVYDSTDQPMFVLFDMYIGGWTRGTDASTPNELKTEVDWVRVWQS
jgi:beta-glucanase (GH16 family)